MTKGMNYSTAEKKAEAVEIEKLIKSGVKTRAAVEKIAYSSGMSERTLFTCLARTKGVLSEDRVGALARKKAPPRKRLICHPEALKMFIELCRAGGVITECYRQVEIEAKAKNWSPFLPERTMRRILDRQVSWVERYTARRAAKTKGNN
jgi:hypothetical protein